ncbi:hypothetical protein ACH4CE_22945 [Streptomyces gelaticus]|uniref:MmyB family transcriptional regulator n=1 Tax=Streptomyces gelaticus TaxID=285446 RepID=UPI0037A3841B
MAGTPGRQSDAFEMGPEIQGIIDALDPRPAVVYNARYDILATNPAYRDLFAGSGLLRCGGSERGERKDPALCRGRDPDCGAKEN